MLLCFFKAEVHDLERFFNILADRWAASEVQDDGYGDQSGAEDDSQAAVAEPCEVEPAPSVKQEPHVSEGDCPKSSENNGGVEKAAIPDRSCPKASASKEVKEAFVELGSKGMDEKRARAEALRFLG